jgi:INO80 complex subunit C
MPKVTKTNIIQPKKQEIEEHAHHHEKHRYKYKACFKKPNWNSKFRNKDKNARAAKNMKNLMIDSLDSLSYNLCKLFNLDQSIEAGPSIFPKKKYCDLTGFQGNYQDPTSGLRYYNAEIYKIIQNLSDPIKNQYLSIRKALFIIK